MGFKRFLFIWLFCCCLPSVSSGIKAQTVQDTGKVYQLQEVQIEAATRPSTSRSSTPLQVMNGEEISRLGAQTLSDAVRHFSGVTVKDYGGLGGLKTVSIRSLGAQHTAVSYDGVTVSDAQSGQVDIGRFSLDNLSQLSLFIGQADNIFQTARMFASAGVLNLQTTKPALDNKSYDGKVQVKGGSFGFFSPSMRYAQRFNNTFSASLFGNWQQTDGNYPFTLENGKKTSTEKRINSDLQSLNTELNLYADFKDKGSFSLKSYYYNSERGLPGAVIIDNPYSATRLWDKNYFTQLHYKNRFNNQFSFQAQAKYNYTYNRYLDINNKYEGGKQDDRYTQQEYYGSGALQYTPVTGLSFSLAEDFFVNTLDNTLPYCVYPQRYTSLTALAAQYKTERFTVTGSLLGTYITERVESGDTPNDRKKLSPAVSFSFQPIKATNLRVRASYKDIFRVPTFNDLYYSRIGNTDLKPESASQYNLGLTWCDTPCKAIEYLTLSADVYYNRVHDKIVAIPTLFIWKMMNVGEVDIRGLDLNANATISLQSRINLQLSGSYTYQKALDITDKTSDIYRNQIHYTPEHSGSGVVTLNNPWINATYSFIASGMRYALPENIPNNQIEGYVEQSISLNKTIQVKKTTLQVQGDIINLSGKTYEVIEWYPMPGRSYKLSLGITF